MLVHLILYRDFYSVPSHFLETVQLPIQQLMHCKICKRRIHHFSDARWMYRIKYTTFANTKQTKQIRGWHKTYVAHTMLRWNKYTSQWEKTAQNGCHYPKSQLPKQQIIASQFMPCIKCFPNAQKRPIDNAWSYSVSLNAFFCISVCICNYTCICTVAIDLLPRPHLSICKCWSQSAFCHRYNPLLMALWPFISHFISTNCFLRQHLANW